MFPIVIDLEIVVFWLALLIFKAGAAGKGPRVQIRKSNVSGKVKLIRVIKD